MEIMLCTGTIKSIIMGLTVLLAFVESEGERNVDSVKASMQYCG